MQILDLLILIACATAAFGGYRMGLVARVASWVGIFGGFSIAIVVLPRILRAAEGLSDSSRLGIAVLALLAGVLIGQMLGLVVGAHVSQSFLQGKLRVADHISGIFVGVFGVLLVLWLVLPLAADLPGWSAQQVRSSEVARQIDEHAPDPPDAVKTIGRLVGQQNFPPVFDGLAPAPDTGPPPVDVTLPVDVVQRVKQSTVKVEGVACRRTQNGSGFAIGPNLFVTNAHVVAGEPRTSILAPDGEEHDATVVAFDPNRDLALLRSSTYSAPPLTISEAQTGETGAVFGHPGGQDAVRISPAAVRTKVQAVGRDLYDSKQTRREVLILASNLRQGDSGAPLVDTRGELIGVAFAIAPDNPDTAYALDTSELRAVLGQSTNRPVDTGACLAE